MPVPAGERDFDIVVLGATGFTGELTAAYLAEHAPPELRWAIAGRNRARLEAVRGRLRESAGAEVPIVVADSTDDASLRALAASTRVVATTVGPYLAHGEPLVAACAAEGTDYVDLTGEPEFVDRMYLEHHATAAASDARLVHACGFDSIPHDLGVYFTVRQLGTVEQPLTVEGVVRSDAAFSGGTFHSLLGAASRAKQMSATMKRRRAAEPRPEGRRSRAVAGKPRRDRAAGLWLLPLPTIDPFVVARSGAALAAYGPDFRYSHYAGLRTLRYTAGAVVGAGALGAAAQVPPLRRFLGNRVPQGQGPSAERRARSWFTVDLTATVGERVLRTRVSGGDPGYTETAKMLAESALCLALDDNPATAGQVTTAVAMGEALLARLQAAGIGFETV